MTSGNEWTGGQSSAGRPRRGKAATTPSRWRRLRRGLEGGALGTLVMTAYRLPVTRSLPPTAAFWAKFVGGGRPEEYPAVALVLHFVYGIAAGGALAAALPSHHAVVGATGTGTPSPRDEVSLTAVGLLYGLVLSVFGERVVLKRVLGVDPDDRFAFHVGHVLYGITLGAWLGTRTREERDSTSSAAGRV